MGVQIFYDEGNPNQDLPAVAGTLTMPYGVNNNGQSPRNFAMQLGAASAFTFREMDQARIMHVSIETSGGVRIVTSGSAGGSLNRFFPNGIPAGYNCILISYHAQSISGNYLNRATAGVPSYAGVPFGQGNVFTGRSGIDSGVGIGGYNNLLVPISPPAPLPFLPVVLGGNNGVDHPPNVLVIPLHGRNFPPYPY
jgi:hypothetical protein